MTYATEDQQEFLEKAYPVVLEVLADHELEFKTRHLNLASGLKAKSKKEACLQQEILRRIWAKYPHGEYPIMYYAHESHPPSVRKLADDFETFLNDFLDYEQWADEDAE